MIDFSPYLSASLSEHIPAGRALKMDPALHAIELVCAGETIAFWAGKAPLMVGNGFRRRQVSI